MKEIKTSEELHRILLDIAKTFHRICESHNIPYCMLGGTMLGAVRHKGFIPWDDDMDFGVPRKYFNGLQNILAKELPEKYDILTIRNSKALLIDIIKIHDKRTIIKELYKENLKEGIGVNIDIFPLDRTSMPSGAKKSKVIKWLMGLQKYRFLSTSQRPWYKKIIAYIIKFLFYPIDRLTIINFINTHLIDKEGAYIANHFGAWGDREIVVANVIEPSILYCFEDTNFYGVACPVDYLSSLYGNYMVLPSEDKRHLHIENVYWKG